MHLSFLLSTRRDGGYAKFPLDAKPPFKCKPPTWTNPALAKAHPPGCRPFYPQDTSTSGRYASHWKAYLLVCKMSEFITLFYLNIMLLNLTKYSFLDNWIIERSNQERARYFKKKDHKGYIRKPLLNIEPQCCPPDHLHMQKSLITRLLNQVWVHNATLIS